MRTGTRKLPRSSVNASNCVPVASCTARTETPGRTPAVESLTVPAMVASCAEVNAGNARQDIAIRIKGRTYRRPIGVLLPQAFVLVKRIKTAARYPEADDDYPWCLLRWWLLLRSLQCLAGGAFRVLDQLDPHAAWILHVCGPMAELVWLGRWFRGKHDALGLEIGGSRIHAERAEAQMIDGAAAARRRAVALRDDQVRAAVLHRIETAAKLRSLATEGADVPTDAGFGTGNAQGNVMKPGAG